MKNLKTYAILEEARQTGYFSIESYLIQVPDRKITSIPLDGIIKFRYFNSDADFNSVMTFMDSILKQEVPFVGNIEFQDFTKWFYIGNEMNKEQRDKLIKMITLFGPSHLEPETKMLDAGLKGIEHPILLTPSTMNSSVEKIYPSSIRSESKVLMKDFIKSGKGKQY